MVSLRHGVAAGGGVHGILPRYARFGRRCCRGGREPEDVTSLQLYLLRHGEPDLHGQFYGHADVPLSPRGRTQAQAQAQALAARPLVAIYSSDLGRATEGGRLLAALGEARPAPEVLRALREMHLGVLERLAFSEAGARYPELAGRSYEDMLEFRMPEGGESVRDVAARVVPCIEAIILRHARRGSPEGQVPAVAIVAHNTVVRVSLACAAGLGPAGYVRFEQGLGAISRVDVGDRWDRDPWAAARISLCNWVPEPGAAGTPPIGSPRGSC
jgi:probable phosphoglycerate mutase